MKQLDSAKVIKELDTKFATINHNHDTNYVKLNDSITIPIGKRLDLKNDVPIWGFSKNSGAPYNLLKLNATDQIEVGSVDMPMILYSKGNIKTIVKNNNNLSTTYELYHTGNKPTPNDIGAYSKDEIMNSSVYNIVRNGDFKNGLAGWGPAQYNPNGTAFNVKIVDDTSEWVLDGKKALVIQSTNNTSGEYRADSQKFKVKQNTFYTLSYLVAAHRVTEIGHYIRGDEWATIDNYSYCPLAGGKNPKDWTRITRTFNTGTNSKINVNFIHFKTDNDSFSWFTDVTITEGVIPRPFLPNPEELLTDNIAISNNSVVVRSNEVSGQSTSQESTLSSSSIGFSNVIEGTRKYSSIGMLNNSLEVNANAFYIYTNNGVKIPGSISIGGKDGCNISNSGLNANADYAFNMGDVMRLGYIACQSVVQMSDRKLKENIKYINKNETNVSSSDFYNFFLNEFKPVSFKFKNSIENTIELGFIAQDVQESKISEYIIIDKENKDLSFSNNSFTSSIAIALQEAIKKIENLEEQLYELKSKINS